MQQIESATTEQWEKIVNSMYTVQRVSNCHPNVLASKFSPLIRLLSKQVSNLRSQVSRNSVVSIANIYTNLKKPYVDIDLEIVVNALVTEYGKTNVFMREEINKALEAVLAASTSARLLVILFNTGLKHKNKDVRNTTACYTAKIVQKIGVDKVYTRDFMERIFECMASFIVDPSPDVRHSGKSIVNDVMGHHKFKETCDQLLTEAQAKGIRKCANTIQERGLRSSQNSGYKRSSINSNSSPQQQHQQQQQQRPSFQPEPSGIKEILSRISKGDIQSKREAIDDLFDKVLKRQQLSEDVTKKVTDVFVTLLTTSNSKANFLALQNMKRLVASIKLPGSVLQTLLASLLKLTATKYGDLSKGAINKIVSSVDNQLLIQPFSNQAIYANGKARQFALEKLTELIASVPIRSVERHVFPVLWRHVTTSQVRREVTKLAQEISARNSNSLLAAAETNNFLPQIKSLLDAS